MIKNYLKIAWRNLWKGRSFSVINILGLAMGLSCFILIAMFVADELSYDKFNEKANRIYRINADIRFGGTDLTTAKTGDPMGATLKRDYSQVEEYARIYTSSGPKFIKKGTEFINENAVVYADSTLFNIFSLPALHGDTKTALSEPNSVVITESAAMRYFGNTDVLGKTLETNDDNPTFYKVTSVIKDIPRHSHFNFDFFFPMMNLDYNWDNFLSHNFQTYILLQQGTDYKKFEKNFSDVINKYLIPQASHLMNIKSMEDFEKSGNKLEYSLMPVTDIHLHSNRVGDVSPNSDIRYVYIFSAIAVFILLLACVNFMNLSTARSAKRAKEVGIRKVLGSEKKSLINQFLLESVMTAFLGMVLALCLVGLFVAYMNDISGKELGFSMLLHPAAITFLLALPFVVGILAGLYPAFFLSAFQPVTVLKGKISKGVRKNNFRSALVVFQFFTSIVIIVATIVVFRQLSYIQNKNIGFNKEQVLILNGTDALARNTDAFKNEVVKMDAVKSGSFAGYLPVGNSSRNSNTWSTETVITEKNGFNMQIWDIDYDYIPTLGMEMMKGRNFSKDYGSDSSGVIINETTARMIGVDNPIGKRLYMTNFDDPGNPFSYTVVGVVKNFNYESLRENVAPLAMRLGDNKWAAAFRISSEDVSKVLNDIKNKWSAMAPGMPFRYQFLDEAFYNMYRSEERVGKVALSFAVIAILIACLGLFGLVAYMSEQRTKEIGVRKVLGASVSGIVVMLSKDFAKLIVIGTLLAFPIAWWAMNKWLEDFAYRINISWWIFATAAFLTLIVAMATIVFQAIKAAIANPIKSLRTE